MFECAQSNNNVGWYGTTFLFSNHGLKYFHIFLIIKK